VIQQIFVQRVRGDGQRFMPAGNFWSRHQAAGRYGKRRRVQRLADVADRVASAGMLVKQASASREIEQRQANQPRGQAAPALFSGFGRTLHLWRPIHTLPCFLARIHGLVAFPPRLHGQVLDPATILP